MNKLKFTFFLIGVLVLGFFFGLYADDVEKISSDIQNEYKKITDTEIEIATVTNEAAVNSLDFSNAPRFSNYQDLVRYLKECKKNLETKVSVMTTNGFSPNINELIQDVACWNLKSTTYSNGSENIGIVFEFTNYPGERVAYAYLHNDTSFLTNEEKKLYKIAVQIVNEAKKFSSGHTNPALYRELYIHDAITQRVNYYSGSGSKNLQRAQSAIGALIDGKANCQGYSDAFYMLGTMCRLNVDKIAGNAGNESHMWNVVNFGDDKFYFVDVTWDDASYTFSDTGEYSGHIYFNAPADVMTTHSWKNPPVNLQQHPDGRYFYYTEEFNNSDGEFFGAYLKTPQDALKYVAKRIAKGQNMNYVCSATYDKKYSEPQFAIKYLTNNLLPNIYGWRGSVRLNVSTRGNYMFFTVESKRG
ncbi:MAG: hypothetical protein IJT06_02040 [Selenomonadaceae bacterium]|nr:hypothetical protein [Selenomonadaceae bacterium]